MPNVSYIEASMQVLNTELTIAINTIAYSS